MNCNDVKMYGKIGLLDRLFNWLSRKNWIKLSDDIDLKNYDAHSEEE